MGTPAFSLHVLQAIERLGWPIASVYTVPDSPAGRGRVLRPTAVKAYAEARGYPVLTPESLRAAEEVDRLRSLQPDLVVLAAYGKLLPPEWLATPPLGCLNVHPSLLPRHRGAVPVPATILAGDAETGVSLMVMDAGMDTGPVVAQARVPLRGDERAPELTDRLFRLGADLLLTHGPAYVAGKLPPEPQPSEGATVSRRLKREHGVIDWTKPAVVLERQTRAYDPWPGAVTSCRGRKLDVLEARVEAERADAPPGTVVALRKDGIAVATGDGLLVLRRVRLEGRNPVAGADFARGQRDMEGAVLGEGSGSN